MTLYHLHDECWIPKPRSDVFSFFGDAHNLDLITPPWLRFEILTPGRVTMQVGTLIDYRLRLYGLPIRWQTEITAWEPMRRFVDEQRRGPYRRWRHTHTFIDQRGGTLCCDDVEYAVPGGALIYRLFVRRDVQRIFAYRREAVLRIFGGAATRATASAAANGLTPGSSPA